MCRVGQLMKWCGVEYFLNGKGDMDLDYIKALEKSMIDSGVKVPLSFNDVSLDSPPPRSSIDATYK